MHVLEHLFERVFEYKDDPRKTDTLRHVIKFDKAYQHVDEGVIVEFREVVIRKASVVAFNKLIRQSKAVEDLHKVTGADILHIGECWVVVSEKCDDTHVDDLANFVMIDDKEIEEALQ